MLSNVKLLGTAARRLDVPIIATEQYPKGLGPTLPDVRAALDGVQPLAKTSFSCCGAEGFLDRLRALGRTEVVLVGIEAHVCVLLTALDLIAAGFRVSVVADAVCSRKPERQEIGLAQARQAGAVITTTETVVFQLLGRADTEVFREVSKLLR
jgi:isochorismate hydrolase